MIKQFRELAVGSEFVCRGFVYAKKSDTFADRNGSDEGRVFEPIDLVEVGVIAKNCTINVWNELGWDLDAGMLDFCMRIAARHAPQAHTIDIYPQERIPVDAPVWKNPGWLEWCVRPHYRGGGTLHIGCIQRTVGADFESHT